MLKRGRFTCIAMTCLLLVACATPYQEGSTIGELMFVSTGGYRTTQLESDVFIVEYFATPVTPADTIVKYMQYRCSTLALEKGYDGFTYQQPITESPPRPQTKKHFYTQIILRKRPYPEGGATVDAEALRGTLESFVKSQ